MGMAEAMVDAMKTVAQGYDAPIIKSIEKLIDNVIDPLVQQVGELTKAVNDLEEAERRRREA